MFETERKKILVCRIGAFGDVCMTLPVVHSLSRHFEVHWLIRRGHDAILRLFPEVECRPVVFEPGAPRSVRSDLVTELAGARYDALLDFSNWRVVAELASQLKDIPLRAIAYDSTRRLALQRMRNSLPWSRPFNRIVEIDGAVHRVFKWQQLVRVSLGCTLSIRWPLQPVGLPDEGVRIFVHPHASRRNKLWETDNFVQVLTQLAERKVVHCFVNQGHAGEQRIAGELGSRLRQAGIEVTPVLFDPSFIGLREALLNVHFALGPDSGPMHFASLMGIPTVVIYGPSSPMEVAPLWRTVGVTPPRGGHAIGDVTPAMALDAIGRVFSLLFDRTDEGVRV